MFIIEKKHNNTLSKTMTLPDAQIDNLCPFINTSDQNIRES